MTNLERYFTVLNMFNRYKIDYVAIGTWALKLAYPKIMKGYIVTDCDIIIKPDIVEIRKGVKLLMENKWTVTVWEKPIDEFVAMDFLRGKYYIRAKQQDLVLDISFECAYVNWQELYTQSSRQKNYTLASLEYILLLKKIKATEKDLQVISLFG